MAYAQYGPVQPKGLAITSMVLGIVGLVFCWVWWLGLPASIVGLILGIVALKKGQPRGMALAGIITAGVALALAVIVTIIILILVFSVMGVTSYY